MGRIRGKDERLMRDREGGRIGKEKEKKDIGLKKDD